MSISRSLSAFPSPPLGCHWPAEQHLVSLIAGEQVKVEAGRSSGQVHPCRGSYLVRTERQGGRAAGPLEWFPANAHSRLVGRGCERSAGGAWMQIHLLRRIDNHVKSISWCSHASTQLDTVEFSSVGSQLGWWAVCVWQELHNGPIDRLTPIAPRLT